MLIDLTAEEKRKTQKLADGSLKNRKKIAAAIEAARAAGDEDELKRLLIQQQESLEAWEDKLAANFDMMQRKRFNPIKEAGADAIIANAKEQAPAILEYTYRMVPWLYQGAEAELLEMAGVGTIKNNVLYLKKSYAMYALKEELKLHFDALSDNQEATLELVCILEAAIKAFPHILTGSGDDQIPGQMSLFDLANDGKKEHAPSPLKQAEKEGAITTLGGYLTSISSKNYQHAFSSYKNKYAYLVNAGMPLLQDIINDTQENEEGYLAVSDENKKKLDKSAKQNPIDSLLVKAFFSAVSESADTSEMDPRDPRNKYTRVYLPKFCRELNVRFDALREDSKDPDAAPDPEENAVEVVDGKNSSFSARMREVQGYIGVLNENSFYKFVTIAGFDEKTQILYLDTPYFNFLLPAVRDDQDRKVMSKRNKLELRYEKQAENKLFHSDLVGCRNRTGADIAYYIVDQVLNRGTTPDRKLKQNENKPYEPTDRTVTCRINCYDVIKAIPAFKYRLESMKATDKARDGKTTKAKTRSEQEHSILTQQNKALKSAFSAAYKIIREKSDFYQYYKEATITEIIPLMRQLKKTEILITHEGVNMKFKKMC